MTYKPWKTRLTSPRAILALASAFALLSAGSLAWSATAVYTVSQRNRAFNPGLLALNQGDTVRIVNDDGDLLHHAYIDSDTFTFDSGDQEPGSHVDIAFSKTGTFNVLCGIHPKMKLVVTVK